MPRLIVIYSLIMKFMVKYRGKSGALQEDCIDAANRSACMAECHNRGIVPMAIRESDGEVKSARLHNSEASSLARRGRKVVVKRLWLAGVGVALCTFLCLWRVTLRKPTPTSPTHRSAPVKQVQQKPSPAPASKVPAHKDDSSVGHGRPAPEPVADNRAPSSSDSGETYMGSPIVGRDVKTNRFGEVSEIITTADGRTHLVNRPEKPVFTSASDQLLAMATSGGSGPQPPLPFRPGLEADFRKAIETPIVVHDDDPENVKEAKRRVIEARIQMKEMLDGGMSFEEVLREHQKLSNENATMRAKAFREYRALVDAGDAEGAAEYADKVNKALSQLGIEGISVPGRADPEPDKENE